MTRGILISQRKQPETTTKHPGNFGIGHRFQTAQT